MIPEFLKAEYTATGAGMVLLSFLVAGLVALGAWWWLLPPSVALGCWVTWRRDRPVETQL